MGLKVQTIQKGVLTLQPWPRLSKYWAVDPDPGRRGTFHTSYCGSDRTENPKVPTKQGGCESALSVFVFNVISRFVCMKLRHFKASMLGISNAAHFTFTLWKFIIFFLLTSVSTYISTIFK